MYPRNIRETAYWQKGEQSQSGFVSTWGAFPFFKSGKIIINKEMGIAAKKKCQELNIDVVN